MLEVDDWSLGGTFFAERAVAQAELAETRKRDKEDAAELAKAKAESASTAAASTKRPKPKPAFKDKAAAKATSAARSQSPQEKPASSLSFVDLANDSEDELPPLEPPRTRSQAAVKQEKVGKDEKVSTRAGDQFPVVSPSHLCRRWILIKRNASLQASRAAPPPPTKGKGKVVPEVLLTKRKRQTVAQAPKRPPKAAKPKEDFSLCRPMGAPYALLLYEIPCDNCLSEGGATQYAYSCIAPPLEVSPSQRNNAKKPACLGCSRQRKTCTWSGPLQLRLLKRLAVKSVTAILESHEITLEERDIDDVTNELGRLRIVAPRPRKLIGRAAIGANLLTPTVNAVAGPAKINPAVEPEFGGSDDEVDELEGDEGSDEQPAEEEEEEEEESDSPPELDEDFQPVASKRRKHL